MLSEDEFFDRLMREMKDVGESLLLWEQAAPTEKAKSVVHTLQYLFMKAYNSAQARASTATIMGIMSGLADQIPPDTIANRLNISTDFVLDIQRAASGSN